MPYDKTIQVGDIIRTYHKGIHRVTKIESRVVTEANQKYYPNQEVGHNWTPLFHYEKILDADLKPTRNKGQTNCCDASYCSRVTRNSLKEELAAISKTYKEAIAVLFGSE
jgi:hypothetical protein